MSTNYASPRIVSADWLYQFFGCADHQMPPAVTLQPGPPTHFQLISPQSITQVALSVFPLRQRQMADRYKGRICTCPRHGLFHARRPSRGDSARHGL